MGKKEELLFCHCHLSIEDSPETLNDLFGSRLSSNSNIFKTTPVSKG